MIYRLRSLKQYEKIDELLVSSSGCKVERIEPFWPKDIEINYLADFIVINGFVGDDYSSNHDFKIMVKDSIINSYDKFEDIPNEIEHVIRFVPNVKHDIEFKYVLDNGDVYCQNVHNHFDWNSKLSELMKRERN